MEQDNVTRLYYHEDSPHRVRETYPNPWDYTWTTGAEAESVYGRADYICIHNHSRNPERRYAEIYRPEDRKNSFEIDRLGNHRDNLAHIAKKIEEVAGRQGLTIIVY